MKRLFTVLGLVLAMSAVAPLAMAAGGCGDSSARSADTQATDGAAGKDVKAKSGGKASGLNRGQTAK